MWLISKAGELTKICKELGKLRNKMFTCQINTELFFLFFLTETTYKVTVTTSDIRGAGTDANVSLVIFGECGDSGEVALKHSETYKDKFERDHQDVFYLKHVLSLGKIRLLLLRHLKQLYFHDLYAVNYRQ